MRYLKLVFNEFQNASHDKRELCAAEELGYNVQVFATTKEASNFREYYDGYDVFRISTRRLGKQEWLRPLNRGVAFFNFIIAAINSDADIISGHDYVAALAGYIANLFKRHKAKLIYDSHEFALYQDLNRSELRFQLIKLIEGFLIRRVDLSLMVGDKIADAVREIYQLEARPTVVRNIPQYWHLKMEKSTIIRRWFIEKLGLPDNGFLLMYHGGIMVGRGIESAIRSLPLLPDDIGFIVMGYETAPGMIEIFRGLAQENGVASRVYFHPAVPMTELKDYISAVDVELILIEGKYCVSYEYSLPNKFFESIQACVPMICANLPEMGKIVRQYDIGLLVNEDDEKSIAEAVLKLRHDRALYGRLKRNMEKAKDELCWEKESLILKAALRAIM